MKATDQLFFGTSGTRGRDGNWIGNELWPPTTRGRTVRRPWWAVRRQGVTRFTATVSAVTSLMFKSGSTRKRRIRSESAAERGRQSDLVSPTGGRSNHDQSESRNAGGPRLFDRPLPRNRSSTRGRENAVRRSYRWRHIRRPCFVTSPGRHVEAGFSPRLRRHTRSTFRSWIPSLIWNMPEQSKISILLMNNEKPAR